MLAGLWAFCHRSGSGGVATKGHGVDSLGHGLDLGSRPRPGDHPGVVLLPLPSGGGGRRPWQTLAGGASGHGPGGSLGALVCGPDAGVGVGARAARGLASDGVVERSRPSCRCAADASAPAPPRQAGADQWQ